MSEGEIEVDQVGDGAVDWLVWVRRDRLLWNTVAAFFYLQLLVAPPAVYSYLSNCRGWPRGASLSAAFATAMVIVLGLGVI